VARPDIGAAYGAQYTNSGFQLWISGKPADTYYVAAWVHSTITGNWLSM
jgi:hypothetical protein